MITLNKNKKYCYENSMFNLILVRKNIKKIKQYKKNELKDVNIFLNEN